MEKLVITDQLNPTSDFWRGKRVLLTGHTGFKGAWAALWLDRLGAKVSGISLPSVTTPNLFSLVDVHTITDSYFCDVRDKIAIATIIKDVQPEIVFHLAAQALVHASYRDPLTTFSTNVLGTSNVLEALRSNDSVRVIVVVTTDKVYKNLEQLYPYRETDEIGGHDPYSASKAAAEMVIASYRDSFFCAKGVAVASARAGNVIGGGDWSEDRLIPDAIRAWKKDRLLQIRRPEAVRPWQHVLEPLAGYFRLAEKLWHQPNLAGAYNFGPQTENAASVRTVIQLAQKAFGMGQVSWEEGTSGLHEAGLLALEVSKARKVLGVKPRWSLDEAVRRTINWYRLQQEGSDVKLICEGDIAAYELAMES
jgi:CDP-glucose 4,6-dehydratase